MSFWSRIERSIENIAGELIPDEFRERLSLAQQDLENGRLVEAELLLLDLVKIRPGHSTAQVLLGVTQLQLAKPGLAQDTFDRALALESDMPEALIGRGNAALALNNAEDSIPYFRDAIDSASGERELLSEIYHGLGRAYRSLGDLGKAIRELRKAAAESDGDAAIIAALGDALRVDGDRSHSEARRYLERLANRDGCPPVAWLTLGRIALNNDDPEEAERNFVRVIRCLEDDEQSGRTLADSSHLMSESYLGSADANLAMHQGEQAELVLNKILALPDSKIPSIQLWDRLGQASLLMGQADIAMTRFRRALTGQSSHSLHPVTAKRALSLALSIGDIPSGVEMANLVLSNDAEDADALTARGLDLAANQQADAARATYRHALQSGSNHETYLALAALELQCDNDAQALEYAIKALRAEPNSERAIALLASCQSANLGVQLQKESSWYDLASALSRLCAQEPSLSGLRIDAARALAEYDQPLLVAVMGEFSSGKSSFVNAFVGTDVAPTGITPTTATINIVKYGRSKAGRVVYRDNTSRDIEGKLLFEALGNIDDDEARRVQHVEILMPIDVLERVNIIDTPGLNSILPEHEAVARAFLKRADAVIWIFTVNQAGKSTEKLALDSIRETGVRVLGVLNKVDQLSEPQVAEVLDYVKTELGDRVEACIPISARRAIAGESDSGWDTMREELDIRFFEQARAIKMQALDRRIDSVLGMALHTSEDGQRKNEDYSQALRSASERANAEMLSFIDVAQEERRLIGRDAGILYRNAAREILELVRPRKLPFGSHKATQADRDYLLGLLDSGFEALLNESQLRCTSVLKRSVEDVLSPIFSELEPTLSDLELQIEEGLKLTQAEVWTRCLAYVRGYLRGGFVDHFFQSALPKIDLSEDAIYHALFRAAPELDAELSLPLARAGSRLLEELGRSLDRRASRAKVDALTTDSGLHQALVLMGKHRLLLAKTLHGNSH